MTNRLQFVSSLFLAFLLIWVVPFLSAAKRPQKLSPAFHKDRLEEIYRRCPDGLILLRGEVDCIASGS